jgi:hypothetical protein
MENKKKETTKELGYSAEQSIATREFKGYNANQSAQVRNTVNTDANEGYNATQSSVVRNEPPKESSSKEGSKNSDKK